MTESDNRFTGLSNALADAAERAGAATVLVNARRRMPASGVIYRPDLILTADHVVERDEDVSVLLPDGREEAVVVAGRDPGSDLAVLRLEEGGLSPAATAPAEGRVAQLVLAIARPSASGIQASLGIISAVGGPARTGRGGLLERYFHVDAIPYPGFSGGPLVDSAGQVVGLNTSGLARGSLVAIPAGVAWQVADTLAQFGHVRRGYLGVRSQRVDVQEAARAALGREQHTGLLIVGVEAGSPAAEGGLMVGDILVAMDGEPVREPDDLMARLAGGLVGRKVNVQVLRGGQAQTIPVTIGEKQS